VKPTVSRMFCLWAGLKPASSKASSKTPIGNGARRYSPTPFVTAVICGTCKAGLVAVTVKRPWPGELPGQRSVVTLHELAAPQRQMSLL